MVAVKDVIRFDKSASKKVLQYFDKEVNDEGFVVESDTKRKVFTFDGQDLHINEFGGIFVGSEIYIKSDIVSIIKFLQRKTQNDNTG